LQQTVEKLMEKVVAKVEGLQSSITKTFSSSKEKGTFGETFTETMLKKAFDCDIQSVGKSANTSDIRMSRGPDHEYFWEVKNYTRMVTADEIEKLRRDLRLPRAEVAGEGAEGLGGGRRGAGRGRRGARAGR
jgi:hypothetical protein